MTNEINSTLTARRALERMDQELAAELTPAQKIAAVMAKYDLTVEADFVPFSQSRNKAQKHKSLNWRITLKHKGRAVLITDYSAGEAYCPSYKQHAKQTLDYAGMIGFETEKGFEAKPIRALSHTAKGKPVLCDPVAVIWSLGRDSDALDYPTFESWAEYFGYDPDSRTGEKIYRQCLEIALKLRGALGDAGLQELREAGQDY